MHYHPITDKYLPQSGSQEDVIRRQPTSPLPSLHFSLLINLRLVYPHFIIHYSHFSVTPFSSLRSSLQPLSLRPSVRSSHFSHSPLGFCSSFSRVNKASHLLIMSLASSGAGPGRAGRTELALGRDILNEAGTT